MDTQSYISSWDENDEHHKTLLILTHQTSAPNVLNVPSLYPYAYILNLVKGRHHHVLQPAVSLVSSTFAKRHRLLCLYLLKERDGFLHPFSTRILPPSKVSIVVIKDMVS